MSRASLLVGVPDGGTFVARWLGDHRGVYRREGDNVIGILNTADGVHDGYRASVNDSESVWEVVELIDPDKAAIFEMLALHGQLPKALALIGLEPAV